MNAYADLTTLKSEAYLNISGTTNDVYMRKLLENASRVIDNECQRYFFCYEGTRYADGSSKKVWLSEDVLSLTTLKTDDDGDGIYENTWTENTDFNLYPLNKYPKLYVEIGYNASYTNFANGIPKAIELVGVFGFGDGLSAIPYVSSGGTGTVATTTDTTLTLSSDNLVIAGQTIKCESEQMYVQSVSASNATVRRGVNGTTAAVHSLKTIYIYEYPMPVVESCLITAMRVWKRKDSAFMDIVGSPETGQIPVIKGLDPDVIQRLHRGYVKMLGGIS